VGKATIGTDARFALTSEESAFWAREHGGQQMAPNGKYLLLNVPTKKGLIAAGVAIVLFLILAYGLYMAGGKSGADFSVKLADFLLQGAVVSLLFAILKAIIDEH
jgi:hypothetical protein